MTAWVIGSSGQIGRALIEVFRREEISARGFTRQEIDLSQPEQIKERLDFFSGSPKIDQPSVVPSVVINAAAYTQVDLAEKEESLAHRVNAESPTRIAEWCAHHEVPFIHYSTDYVFSGEGSRPWLEEDVPNPLSIYGQTKLDGERGIATQFSQRGKWLILRTSWVYDERGKNFFKTMLKLGQERDVISVVNDQCGTPNYAPFLAQATVDIARYFTDGAPTAASTPTTAATSTAKKFDPFPSGIYHLSSEGETTWFEFAKEIFRTAPLKCQLKVQRVDPIPSSAYPTPAKRPLNSTLSKEKIKQVFGVTLPSWEEGLQACVASLKTPSKDVESKRILI